MDQMDKPKRLRTTNFTGEEKLNILNIIKKYKHVIENKESGVQTWKTKEQAWKAIEKEFNATSATFRSADVIKRFYNNKKKETRKCAANIRFEMNKTGGGEAPTIKDDPIYNLTLDIINKKTVFGLKNDFDGDSHLMTKCTPNVENTHIQNVYEVEDENGGSESVTVDENEIIILQMDDEATIERDVMHDTQASTNTSAQTLQTPTMKRKKPNGADTSNNDWQSRRRPQLTKIGNIALRYEEVADLKKEVLKSQLNILQLQEKEVEEKIEWEKKYRQVRERREKEEYELKKKSLELDVEIKKAQLIALGTLNEAGL